MKTKKKNDKKTLYILGATLVAVIAIVAMVVGNNEQLQGYLRVTPVAQKVNTYIDPSILISQTTTPSLTAPTLTYPAQNDTITINSNNTPVTYKQVTFQWTGNGTQYEFFTKYPGKPDFTSSGAKITSTSQTRTFSVMDDFKNPYYWKVRAYDANGNYKDSPEYMFRLSYAPLSATLLSPANGYVVEGSNQGPITFQWSDTNAYAYKLHIINDMGVAPENTQTFQINGWSMGFAPPTSYTLDQLKINCVSCTWKVESLGPNGESKMSAGNSLQFVVF
jgi:hypothetical protein